MSDTPICDFVKEYIARKPLRFHMPGHKGRPFLGFEKYDITEIDGADSLFEASGIIAESERNASLLFGCPTFYSTEGSSLCVRAMLYLASTRGRGKTVLAARNVHKSFLYAAALLDLEVCRIDRSEESYLSSVCAPGDVAEALDAMDETPCCVYLTTPDYLGRGSDVREIAEVCHARGVLLLVDCAHGAHLRFLDPSLFPTDNGADLCCSSAHKTLPVLTGGAYLHIGNAVKDELAPRAKEALALFASTSPSYLILQSLDAANAALKTYRPRLAALVSRTAGLRKALREAGYGVCEAPAPQEESRSSGAGTACDPTRITIAPKARGYTGNELAEILGRQGIFPEFHDPDFVVFMMTPENRKKELDALEKALLSLPKRAPVTSRPPRLPRPVRAVSVREAILSQGERLPLENCLGRVLRDPGVSCPPAVPILMCGEIVDGQAIEAMRYYGIAACTVVK